jgi:hypothetical protein
MRKLLLASFVASFVIAASIWLLPSSGRSTIGGVNILPWLLPGQ